jgi:hypothetical protein
VIIGRIDLHDVAEIVVLIAGGGLDAAFIRPRVGDDDVASLIRPGDRPNAIRADVGFEKILAGWRKFY